MENRNLPPVDSRDYVIKILSERAQLLENNVKTLATEIARLNMLKNGDPGRGAKVNNSPDKKRDAAVIDIKSRQKMPAGNLREGQKILAAPDVPAKKEELEPAPEEIEKPATENTADPKETEEADGNVKDPKDE